MPMFYEKGGLAAQVGLKSRTTVLDPNPRGVYVPMWFNPGKGVEGASGADIQEIARRMRLMKHWVEMVEGQCEIHRINVVKVMTTARKSANPCYDY